MSYDIISKCLLCSAPTTVILNLGSTGIANELLSTKINIIKYPLSLLKCNACNHLQINTIIDKNRLYKNYNYMSNTGIQNTKHFREYANDMCELFTKPFVVDIGSNDGLFLSFFRERARKVLGVDPAANIAELAYKKGVPTKISFFDENVADDILKEHGKANLITCNNAFAHNADLTTIVKGVKKLLADDGMFVFEVSYAMKLLENNLFDLIYHEHIHHHSLKPLIYFFSKLGMSVVDVKKIPTHGGSIRVFVKHSNSITKRSENLTHMLHRELFMFDELVKKFPIKVKSLKKQFLSRIESLKSVGKTISILGYPAKAATLCEYFGLDDKLINNIYDDNTLKIGKFAHNGMEILNTEDIKKYKPDYLLILSWNYAEQLMEKHNYFKGKFIIPLPTIRVV